MKRITIKILAAAICAVMLPVMAAGCGTFTPHSDKTQVYVSVMNGGFGIKWAEEAAKRFVQRPGYEGYEIKVVANEDLGDEMIAAIDAGTNLYNACFISHTGIGNLINRDYLLDLTSYLDKKIVDSENKTLGQKLLNSELYEQAYGKYYSGGLYALPYGDNFAGFVFDFDTFKAKGWLRESSPGVLAPGPSGIAGNYDEGQPRSMTEWNDMINLIKAEANSYAYIYTTYFPLYLDQVIDAVFAQYAGLEEYEAFTEFNGTITDRSNSAVNVTPAEGYKVFEAQGLYKAAEFFYENLTASGASVHPLSLGTTGTTHRDAQNSFIMGNYNRSASTPLGAMLVEGVWWENESRAIFNAFDNRGEYEYGFGKRDYRYMLFPKMAGQKGIDGHGNGSVLQIMETGSSFVIKSGNEDIDRVAADFLVYTASDEILKYYTLSTGGIRPFDYDLTPVEKGTMTKFQQNVWDIYHDTENIAFIRPNVASALQPIHRFGSRKGRYNSLINSVPYEYPLQALSRFNAEEFFAGLKTRNQTNWSKWYNEVKQYYE